MEGERVAPLSYSVVPPEGEPSAQKPIIVGGLVVAGLVIVSVVAGWFVLGFVESTGPVVNGAPLLILAGGVGVAYHLSRATLRRARRTALAVVTGLAMLAALFTNKTLAGIKPALPQVRAAVDSIDLPPGFTLIDEETYGDRLCRKGCPSVERRYAAPVDDPDPVSTLILAMFDQGWERVADVEPRFATGARLGTLTAQLAENEPHVVWMRVTRLS